MKLCNVFEIEKFKAAINACEGSVWLESAEGDKFNLKSELSKYVAIGALLGESGENLELFCSNREDEELFFRFFNENPEVR